MLIVQHFDKSNFGKCEMKIPFDKLLSDVDAVILRTQRLYVLLYERAHARVLAEILNKRYDRHTL